MIKGQAEQHFHVITKCMLQQKIFSNYSAGKRYLYIFQGIFYSCCDNRMTYPQTERFAIVLEFQFVITILS